MFLKISGRYMGLMYDEVKQCTRSIIKQMLDLLLVPPFKGI